MPLAQLLSPLFWLLTFTQIVGVATVIDGDTIEIRGQRIRLHGIDAPESSQRCIDASGEEVRCGQLAALRLDSLLRGKNCQCQVLDTDRYGRKIAICAVGETNINEWMVAQGQALAYRQYSSDYMQVEREARAARHGIWRYQFEEPWNWRKNRRKPSSTTPAHFQQQSPTGDLLSECTIKGNISSSGERIYHTSTSPWYNRTQIDKGKGERWFCSEEEAQNAGWRSIKY